jgi:hypothetical protein
MSAFMVAKCGMGFQPMHRDKTHMGLETVNRYFARPFFHRGTFTVLRRPFTMHGLEAHATI